MTLPTLTPPTLIFLSGTSSAGKTSIARSLQRVMEEPYLYFSADVFPPMLPPYRAGLGWDVDSILNTMRFGYYECLAAMLSAGNFVITDHVILYPQFLAACARSLASHRAYFVGVRCPLEVAMGRERERGDRTIGLVEEQFAVVHRHGVYDMEVDTAQLPPDECARLIAEHVKGHEPHAFQRLRQQVEA